MKRNTSNECIKENERTTHEDQRCQNIIPQTLLTFRKSKSSVQDEFSTEKAIDLDTNIEVKLLKVNLNKFKHKIAPEAAYDFMQAVGKKRLKRCSSKNDEQTLNNMYQLQNDEKERCPSSKRSKMDNHRSMNKNSSRGRQGNLENPYCEIRNGKSNRFLKYKAAHSKTKEKEFNSSSAVKYFQSEILMKNCSRIKNIWYRRKQSETFILNAEECMPTIEFSSSLITSIFKMHHRQIDEIQYKPYSLEVCSEAIEDDLFDHINFSYIKNNISIQTGRFREEGSSIISKLEIYPEKCRQIPALEFKNMCVDHFRKIIIRRLHKNKNLKQDKQSSITFRNNEAKKYLTAYDLISNKFIFKVEKRKIQASLFTLIPNVSFEFYRINSIDLAETSITKYLIDKTKIAGCAFETGYLKVRKDYKIEPVMNDDKNISEYEICGIWLSELPTNYDCSDNSHICNEDVSLK